MKRGEITTQQIVILIILIASFAILLFFLMELNLASETDKELCRNSVVTRASSSLAGDTVDLKCKTHYVCFTEDGTCEKMTDPDIIEVGNENEVFEGLAKEMADCWWMFGEGDYNYAGEEIFPAPYCSFCSQVGFDDSLKDLAGFESGEISQERFYIYLRETKYSADLTYHEYLFDENSFEEDLEFGSLDIDKRYVVLLGAWSDFSEIKAGIAAGGIFALGTVGVLVGGPLGLAIFAVGAGTEGAIVYDSGDGERMLGFIRETLSGSSFFGPALVELNSNEYQKLQCKDVLTTS